MTVCSGNNLKHAVSAPSTEQSNNIPQRAHADKESLASREGADSPNNASVNIHETGHERTDGANVPWGVNMHLLGDTPHNGNGTKVTGKNWETGSCPGVEGAVGGATSTANSAFFVHRAGTLLANH